MSKAFYYISTQNSLLYIALHFLCLASQMLSKGKAYTLEFSYNTDTAAVILYEHVYMLYVILYNLYNICYFI